MYPKVKNEVIGGKKSKFNFSDQWTRWTGENEDMRRNLFSEKYNIGTKPQREHGCPDKKKKGVLEITLNSTTENC